MDPSARPPMPLAEVVRNSRRERRMDDSSGVMVVWEAVEKLPTFELFLFLFRLIFLQRKGQMRKMKRKKSRS
jgi:hypothetical protein